jgi:hypothetical protein
LAGRKPSEAVRNFLDPLQVAASCVTNSIFSVSSDGYQAGVGHALVLAKGEPVTLGGAPLLLSAALQYDVIKLDKDVPPGGPWRCRRGPTDTT